jgi:putative Mg2+ transporter-C (MgtC) family protein
MFAVGALAAVSDWIGPVNGEAVFRILLAGVLGAVVGWEREGHGRAAGLRTHMMLCVGCALTMLLSMELPAMFNDVSAVDTVVRIDPARLASSVLAGLGFLGAGAILAVGRRVWGLTTAASIWVTAAIGLAVGAGFIVPAVCAHILVMLALLFMAKLERRAVAKDRYIRLRVRFAEVGSHGAQLRSLLADHGMTVLECTVDRRGASLIYNLQLRYTLPLDFEELTAGIADTSARTPESIRWI